MPQRRFANLPSGGWAALLGVRSANSRVKSRLRTRPLALPNRHRFVTDTLLVSSQNALRLA